jgi:UDP-glucose 4-epimerase
VLFRSILVERGHSVRVFDRSPERFRPPIENVEYIFSDFGDSANVRRAVQGVDIVLHLISTTFPGTANQNPIEDIQSNLINTITLLNIMKDVGVSRIVYLSSGGAVYGIPTQLPIPETHQLNPINSYGIVKVTIEHYLKMFESVHGLSPITIRASNPYGPRQSHSGIQGVISTFLHYLNEGKQIEIWGDGKVVRDYLHVVDLANLCVKAAQSDLVGSFNCGSGIGCSLNELIGVIKSATKKDFTPRYKPARLVDVSHSVLNISKASSTFNWRNTIMLEDGIRRTWDWVQQTAKR